MKSFLILIFLTAVSTLAAQTNIQTKEDAFSIYSNLLGGRWEAKGTWEKGQEFHQEIEVSLELTKTIFTVKTFEYNLSAQFDNFQRNYGIRAWDKQEKQMKFWEFDVFGGIISGEVLFNGNDIYHVYQYPNGQGKTLSLADAWIYVDKDTYTFRVCEFVDGKLGKEYMSSTFKRK